MILEEIDFLSGLELLLRSFTCFHLQILKKVFWGFGRSLQQEKNWAQVVTHKLRHNAHIAQDC